MEDLEACLRATQARLSASEAEVTQLRTEVTQLRSKLQSWSDTVEERLDALKAASSGVQSVPSVVQAVPSVVQPVVEHVAEPSSAASPKEVDPSILEPFSNWDNLPLPEDILRGIFCVGWEKPSSFQSKAIKPLLAGLDVLGEGKTGVGKTGAFAIAALAKCDPKERKTRAIILSHSAPISITTTEVVNQLGSYLVSDGMKMAHCLVGGTDIGADIKALEDGVPVICGSLGRIYECISRGALSVDDVKLLVVDEADSVLVNSQLAQFKELVKLMAKPQLAFFSATLTGIKSVRHFIRSIATEPVEILLERTGNGRCFPETVSVYKCNVPCEHKLSATLDILKSHASARPDGKVIIFANGKKRVDELASALRANKVAAAAICGIKHGGEDGMTFEEQTALIKRFRTTNEIKVLVSTTLLAKGFDCPGISLVVVFDFPSSPPRVPQSAAAGGGGGGAEAVALIDDAYETFLHAVGRTGRLGQGRGTAVALLNQWDEKKLTGMLKVYGGTVKDLPESLDSTMWKP
jgi:translation initiation factor 4A